MNTRQLGWALVAGGLVLVAIGLSADSIGLGPVPGFGYKQTAATVVGLVVAAVGVLKVRKD